MAIPSNQRKVSLKFRGGSIMVWEYFSAKSTGNISVIDGRMNAAEYQNILEGNLTISVESLQLPPDWIFRQDNDPEHTAKTTKKLLVENILNILKWPSQFSDLNPIENLWRYLKIQIQ